MINRQTPADNGQFGASGGVASWDTSQDFGSSPPVQASPIPPPAASCCLDIDFEKLHNDVIEILKGNLQPDTKTTIPKKADEEGKIKVNVEMNITE